MQSGSTSKETSEYTDFEKAILIITDPVNSEEKKKNNFEHFQKSFHQFVKEDKALNPFYKISMARSLLGFNPQEKVFDAYRSMNDDRVRQEHNLLDLAIIFNKLQIALFLMEQGLNKEHALDAACDANDVTALGVIQQLDAKTINDSLKNCRKDDSTNLLSRFVIRKSPQVLQTLLDKASSEVVNTAITTEVDSFLFIGISTMKRITRQATYTNIHKIFNACTPTHIAKAINLWGGRYENDKLLINTKLLNHEKTELLTKLDKILIIAAGMKNTDPKIFFTAVNSIIDDMIKDKIYNHDFWIHLLLKTIQESSSAMNDSMIKTLNNKLIWIYYSKIKAIFEENKDDIEKSVTMVESTRQKLIAGDHAWAKQLLRQIIDKVYFTIALETRLQEFRTAKEALRTVKKDLHSRIDKLRSGYDSKESNISSKDPSHYNLIDHQKSFKILRKIQDINNLEPSDQDFLRELLTEKQELEPAQPTLPESSSSTSSSSFDTRVKLAIQAQSKIKHEEEDFEIIQPITNNNESSLPDSKPAPLSSQKKPGKKENTSMEVELIDITLLTTTGIHSQKPKKEPRAVTSDPDPEMILNSSNTAQIRSHTI